jgi:hypothetical protein
MKYKLETIPVWDAFRADSECPFCLLEDEAEKRYIDFFLGNSVMVPEMRVEVNATGFCRSHYPMLFSSRRNRHSLGLVTHTHLQQADKKKEKVLMRLLGFPGKRGMKKELGRAAQQLHGDVESCMICSRIEETVARYLYTALILWKKDEENFRGTWAAGRGFCRFHLASLLAMAGELLPAAMVPLWLQATTDLEKENGKRLEDELLWYTRKFDFQNETKPWGSSKDALQRAIGKLTGKILKEE